MNRELVAEPRERLLEVMLEEVLRPGRGAASAEELVAPSPLRRRSVWLAAALAMVGIGVVVAVAALRRSPDATAPAQDPQPVPRKPWHMNVKPVASQEEWLAVVPHVARVSFRLLRPCSDGNGVEVVEPASDFVGTVPEVRALTALVPPLGRTAFDVNQVESPPFDAWIAFETDDGFRVHGFVRLYGQPTLVLGSRRVDTLTDEWQQAMRGFLVRASCRWRIARGAVESAAELEQVPPSAKAIRCPSPPNGTLEKHLGRFKALEHLELTATTTLATGASINLPIPETPTTLFDEMKVLPNLRHLRISVGLLNSDQRADELARLPQLESLCIYGSFRMQAANVGGEIGIKGGMTVAGMRTLASKIEALELVDCELSTGLLEPWLEAGRLHRLVVFGDAWSPELLARFARLPTLTELGLGGVAWTDAHLQALAGSKLTRLQLEQTKVTTAFGGLPTSLRTLDLRRQTFDESSWRPGSGPPSCRILWKGDVDAADPPLSDVPGATRR